jgi:dynein heavy chain
LLNCFIQVYKDTEIKKVPKEDIDNLEAQMECVFLFCFIWSVCCTVDYDGREKLSVFVRDLVHRHSPKVQLPEKGTVYDYLFSEKTKAFTPWSELFKSFEVDPKLSYSEIMIPTNDSTRNTHLMKTLLS